MEIKLREVEGPGQKSKQEVEEQFIEDQAETETVETETVETETVETETVEKEFGDEDVISYFKSKYNKDIESVDSLFAEKQAEELPEDVSAFLKYKKETGRGINDFMKLQVDYDDVGQDQLLQEYYALTEDDLDSEDISYLIEEKFGYDEDLDSDSEIKDKKIATKRELAKAKKYFNDLKETYRVPAESATSPVNDDELENYNAYKEYISQSQSSQEANEARAKFFNEKTSDVFNDEFKGFEFNIGDKLVSFSSGDKAEVKNLQSDVNNFVSKYLDENGMIKDPKGYHRALNAAMNPEKLANFFYEKGKSDGVGDVSRKSKNVNMDVKGTPQSINNTGFKIRAVESDSGRGLKIKKR